MLSNEDVLARVDHHLDCGEPWRAKEILRGNLAGRYDRELCRRYGELLLELGEEMEAGKYFLLAGSAATPAEAAIDLYLKRRKKVGGRALYMDLPAAARLDSMDGYPARLRQELHARGVRKLPPGWRHEYRADTRSRWMDRLALVGCAMVTFVLGIGLWNGVRVILEVLRGDLQLP